MNSFFDAHCDTMNEILERKCGFMKNRLNIDFERMSKYDRYIQVFAAFVDKNDIDVSPKERVEKIIEVFESEISKSPLKFCKSYKNLENAKYGAVLGIEGGEAIGGSLENLEKFYAKGVRIMTLTWNYDNEISGGITESPGLGLSDFGIEVVERMNELGMIVDVSHLSVKGFWDVAKYSKKPFAASHSNVKSLCSHIRNLDDEQIQFMIKSGGVIGMNFYPQFLDNSGKCEAERIMDHIDHILNMGGENSVGLGSDFDGVEYLPDKITGIESMNKVVLLMKERGYGEELIEKITFGNFMRLAKANFV